MLKNRLKKIIEYVITASKLRNIKSTTVLADLGCCQEMVLNNMVDNLYTQVSSDPGIITYLEGPECREGNPHWAVRAAASIALLIKVLFVMFSIMKYPAFNNRWLQ